MLGDGAGGVRRTFAKYVTLNLLGMVGLSCYILADTFFVANGIGTDGLAALNLGIPVFSLISGAGLLIGVGGATWFGIARGRGDEREANRAFTTAAAFAGALGALFLAAGVFLPGAIAGWLGADAVLAPLATPYIATLLCFAPAFLANNLLVAFLRNDGAPHLAMAAMLTGSLGNIVLDYWFIFPLQWGMFGAAFATGLAPLLGMAVTVPHLLKRRHRFRWLAGGAAVAGCRRIATLGMPAMVNESASGVVMLFFNWTILGVAGNLGVAAYGVIANIALIAVAAFAGVAQGVQPLLSHACGAGRRGVIQTLLKMALVSVALIGGGLYLALAGMPEAVIGVFNRDGDAGLLRLALPGIYCYCAAFPLMGVNIVAAAAFAALGRPRPGLAVALARGAVMLLPLLLVLPRWFGMVGIWLVVPGAELATLLLALGLFMYERKTRHPRN